MQFLVRQWIHDLRQLREVLRRISHIFYVAEDSYPAVLSPFSRRTEKCAQLLLQFTVFLALLTLGNLDIISMTIVADSGCDDLGHFAAFLQLFSGSTSELSLRVSAQALAHV